MGTYTLAWRDKEELKESADPATCNEDGEVYPKYKTGTKTIIITAGQEEVQTIQNQPPSFNTSLSTF